MFVLTSKKQAIETKIADLYLEIENLLYLLSHPADEKIDWMYKEGPDLFVGKVFISLTGQIAVSKLEEAHNKQNSLYSDARYIGLYSLNNTFLGSCSIASMLIQNSNKVPFKMVDKPLQEFLVGRKIQNCYQEIDNLTKQLTFIASLAE